MDKTALNGETIMEDYFEKIAADAFNDELEKISKRQVQKGLKKLLGIESGGFKNQMLNPRLKETLGTAGIDRNVLAYEGAIKSIRGGRMPSVSETQRFKNRYEILKTRSAYKKSGKRDFFDRKYLAYPNPVGVA